MSGTHGEHNTPPKRLCTRARLQKTQRAHLRVPTFKKHHQNSTRRHPERERKKNEMGAGEGKKSEILGRPAEGGPGRGVWDGATKGGAPMGALPSLGFRSLGCRSSGLYCSGCWVFVG